MIETTVRSLTRIDVQALRQCDRICFHHDHDGSRIVAIKEIKKAGPFEDRERQHTISCHGQVRPYRASSVDGARCFSMLHSGRFNEEWMTIVGFVRAGDELRLDWSPDGMTNGYVEKSRVVEGCGEGLQLHADVLYLKVIRGKKRFSFMVDVEICVDNSARMIKI